MRTHNEDSWFDKLEHELENPVDYAANESQEPCANLKRANESHPHEEPPTKVAKEPKILGYKIQAKELTDVNPNEDNVCEEFEVYGKITPLEYIFINPTIISFIIICILVVIIILIFLFHRNIKITNFYLN